MCTGSTTAGPFRENQELWSRSIARSRLAAMPYHWPDSQPKGQTMTMSTVQIQRLESVPLAVIRRQARASELARLVPECCGLVWEAVRAQRVKAGRHVAIY